MLLSDLQQPPRHHIQTPVMVKRITENPVSHAILDDLAMLLQRITIPYSPQVWMINHDILADIVQVHIQLDPRRKMRQRSSKIDRINQIVIRDWRTQMYSKVQCLKSREPYADVSQPRQPLISHVLLNITIIAIYRSEYEDLNAGGNAEHMPVEQYLGEAAARTSGMHARAGLFGTT